MKEIDEIQLGEGLDASRWFSIARASRSRKKSRTDCELKMGASAKHTSSPTNSTSDWRIGKLLQVAEPLDSLPAGYIAPALALFLLRVPTHPRRKYL